MKGVIGIEVGETLIRVAAFDSVLLSSATYGQVAPIGEIFTQECEIQKADTAEGSAIIIQSIDKCLSNTTMQANDVQKIGIALPNPVDKKSRVESTTVVAPPKWIPSIMGPSSIKKFNPTLQVVLSNNANAAAEGERLLGVGGRKPIKYFVQLLIDRGIGAGIVIDGALFRGNNGFAGEVGHLKVENSNEVCQGCGQSGCLEIMASGVAIARKGAELIEMGKGSAIIKSFNKLSSSSFSDLGSYRIKPPPSDPNMDRVEALAVLDAAKTDPDAKEIVVKAGQYLGRGITQIIHILNPEAVIYDGLPLQSDLMKEVIEDEVQNSTMRPLKRDCVWIPSELDGNATLFGAALIANLA